MAGARQWIGQLFLRAPAPFRSVRGLPVLGGWMHRLSHAVLPADQRCWAQVQAGPAEGLWLELNPRTGESYVRGDAEKRVQEIVAKRLRPGMIFYDLGANIGLFSLLAARIVGPEGQVFSFEPDASVVARLRRNIARNNLSNVTVLEVGVWSSTGEFGFVPADPSSPDHGTGQFVAAAGAGAAPLHCVALDDFIAAHPAPGGIKCDVEGAEMEVLRGAETTVRLHRPWILGEMHSEANAGAWREFLRAIGYRLESVDANHILALP